LAFLDKMNNQSKDFKGELLEIIGNDNVLFELFEKIDNINSFFESFEKRFSKKHAPVYAHINNLLRNYGSLDFISSPIKKVKLNYYDVLENIFITSIHCKRNGSTQGLLKRELSEFLNDYSLALDKFVENNNVFRFYVNKNL